jgi:hypothetical protein
MLGLASLNFPRCSAYPTPGRWYSFCGSCSYWGCWAVGVGVISLARMRDVKKREVINLYFAVERGSPQGQVRIGIKAFTSALEPKGS